MTISLPLWTNTDMFKVILTFDNGSTYEAISNARDKVLLDLSVSELDAKTAGNPVGIMQPNSCTLEIWDKDNNLIPTNTDSPHIGYMRNGVKVNLFTSPDDGDTWTRYGEYYTETWNVDKSNGSYTSAVISCTDKLSYIGNMDIPKLSAYIGTDVVTLLREIFTKIGLKQTDYYIDSSFDLHLLISITKGDKLRDVLNTIAQSLIARIKINREGVIMVSPAFPSTEDKYILDNEDIENIQIRHNNQAVYNNVKLLYNKVDNRPSETILTLSNVELSQGVNYFNNLSLDQNILSIDGVNVTADADAEVNINKVEYINYIASQGGIDIEVKSTSPEPFYCNIDVEGRPTGVTDAYVESGINDRDSKIANTLQLESFIIQDEVTATQYVNKVADYLYKMEQEIVLTGTLSPVISTGIYIRIGIGDPTVDGKYLVTGFKGNLLGAGYSTTLTLIKIRGA